MMFSRHFLLKVASALIMVVGLYSTALASCDDLLSPDLYARAFARFIKTSSEYQDFIEWLDRGGLGQVPLPRYYRALSVGSGDGTFDFAIRKRLKGHGVFDFVEPNPIHAAALKGNLGSSDRGDILQVRFEDASLARSYDLILFSHSLYYVNDPLAAIEKALSRLKPKGRVVIVHQTAVGINAFQRNVQTELGLSVSHHLSIEEINRNLVNKNYRVDFFTVPSVLDASWLLRQDAAETSDLMSFFMERNFSKLEPSVQSRGVEIMRAMTRVQANGKLVLDHPVGVSILYRPAAQAW